MWFMRLSFVVVVVVCLINLLQRKMNYCSCKWIRSVAFFNKYTHTLHGIRGINHRYKKIMNFSVITVTRLLVRHHTTPLLIIFLLQHTLMFFLLTYYRDTAEGLTFKH